MSGLLSRCEKGLFLFYILWMAIGLVVTLTGISELAVSHFPLPGFLIAFIQLCLHYGDPFSILLAAISTYWLTCRAWGIPLARRWAIVVLALSALVETVGTLTGWPFGAYHYTENFGPRIDEVLPIVIPCSWFILVTNFLLVVRYFDYLSRWATALLVAAAVTAMDWLMEPFAVQIKRYWVWDSTSVPMQNYLAWFALTFVLTAFFSPPANQQVRKEIQPALILACMLTLFVAARIVSGV